MMIINSKNALVLVILFLLPFVAVAKKTTISATKGTLANEIGVKWAGKKGKLFRAKSTVIINDKDTRAMAALDFKEYPISNSENSLPDKNVRVGFYYYYKMNGAIDYGYIAPATAENDSQTPIRTINQPLLKGETRSSGNSKIISLTLDVATVNSVNQIDGRLKLFRSDRELTMSLGKPTFTQSKSVSFNTTANGVFVDNDVNDKVRLYQYQIIVFDQKGKELTRSNVVEIDLSK